MTLAEILSIASSLVGIVSGPLGLFFAWRASRNAATATRNVDELALRTTGRRISNPDMKQSQ